MDEVTFTLRLKQLQDQVDAHRLVIALLIDLLQQKPNFHPDEISRFLSRQANELDENNQLVELVAELDALREDVNLFEKNRTSQT